MKNSEILNELKDIKGRVNNLIEKIELSDRNTKKSEPLTIHSSEHIKETLKSGRDEIWAMIPNFSNYMVSNLGRVRRVTKARGTRVGKILSPYLKGSVTYRIGSTGRLTIYKDHRTPTVTLCQDNQYKQISIIKLIAFSFANTIIVRENKIIPRSTDRIRMENTRMIIERIDKRKPATLHNLRLNYIPRGERHWNHKLSNRLVHLVRSNLDMKFKDFMDEYGHRFLRVTLQTIRNIFKGDSWRVRTDPIQPMTNPEENYPNGELCNFINVDHVMNSPQSY